MIKISVILLLCFFQSGFAAESSEDLFKKVFGQAQESKKVSLDAILKDYFLGTVTVWVSGGKIEKISGRDLNTLLANKIRDNKKNLYQFPEAAIPVEKLPLKVLYSQAELKLTLLVPDEDVIPQDSALFADLVPYYAKNSTPPAPFSFGTNYKIEKTIGKNTASPNYIEGQTDSFLNIKSIVAENQMHYLQTRQNPWYRQSSRLSYDYRHRMERFEMGDVFYPVIGYQQGQALGGISFYRDFSINPYLRAAPTSTYEYEINSRSLVKTYLNNTLVKSEYMSAGTYSVKDVPLNNGLNKILVEATDEFDKKKVFIFNDASSIESLAPGLARYSVAAGFPAIDNDVSKKYKNDYGPTLSSFYQQGITKHYTLSGYLQGNNQFSLLGTNNILATIYGNFILDAATSKNKYKTGEVFATTYQRNFFDTHWYSTHTLTTKLEYRTPWFNETGVNQQNNFDLTTTASYSIPLFEKLNFSFSGQYQNPTIGRNARFSYNTSITANPSNTYSLSILVGSARDENKLWNTQIYCFLNISFSNQATFASVSYENQSQTKRISVFNDSGEKINNLKISASAEDNKLSKAGSLDLQYNSPIADFGAREDITSQKIGKITSRTSLRFLSSIAFAYDKDNFAFSLSRPIANSFVIFKPATSFKGQRFGTENDSDSSTGLFGELLLSGLVPYQYKRLQLNPTHLGPGNYFGQESYVLYPRFRSGNIFVVGKDNLFVLKGVLRDREKNPMPLKVGFFTTENNKSFAFFTNREGEFYIEGTTTAKGKIQIDDELYSPYELTVDSAKRGIIDVGDIILSPKEIL